nr:DUF1016 family protein [Desulfobacterales bacterium]
MSELMKADYKGLLERVSNLLEQARRETVRRINTVIVQTFWEIGRLIVEEEQKGTERTRYGEYLVRRLSRDLIKRFGRGFTERSLWAMKQFCLTYPKLHGLRAELTWTHYRTLMRIRELRRWDR